jgi:uncharacterized protein (TIGR02757 family)
MKLGTSRSRIALNAAKNNAELRSRPRKQSVVVDLQAALEPLFSKYNQTRFLASDPLEFPHRFRDPWDQEAVAILAAVLAYGNVVQIRKSVEDLLGRIAALGMSPAALVRSLETEDGVTQWREASRGFVHRFNVGEDFVVFLRLLSRSWRDHGSFGAHLVARMGSGDPHFGSGLSRVFDDWESWRGEFSFAGPASFGYLITPPRLGSACKRWCMLLRWMVRKDALDLGLWREGSPLLGMTSPGISPRQLVMPLDTHTGRISQYIGLTERKSLGWKAACEITDRLRACDPDDPVKYDFALARLGILDVCQLRFRVEICMGCDLLQVCRFARKGLSSRASRSTSSSSSVPKRR